MDNEKMGRVPVPRSDSVRVAVRVRPFSQREKNSGSQCVISMHSGNISIRDPKNEERVKTFTFDLTYWSHDGFQKDEDGVLIPSDPASKFAGQSDVFHDIGRGILDSAWRGYNATLLAYGQTGSGKSYSMIGFGTNKGLIPRVCEELFQAIEKQKENLEPQVMFSMLEIYNEQGAWQKEADTALRQLLRAHIRTHQQEAEPLGTSKPSPVAHLLPPPTPTQMVPPTGDQLANIQT